MEGQTMRLSDYLRQAADRVPDSVALVVKDVPMTYAELWRRARSWASQFLAAGITPGQAIVLRTDRTVEFLAAEFGAWSIGAVVVPLDRSRPVHEVIGALHESRARALLASPDVLGEIPRTETRNIALIADVMVHRGPLPEMAASEPAGPAALMLYTSGTTGASKCVVTSHSAMEANGHAIIEAARVLPSDRIMTTISPELPAVLTTSILPAMISGASLHLLNTILPGQIVRYLRRQGISVFFAVPYIYELLCESTASRQLGDLPELRVCMASGAPLHPDIVHRFHILSDKLIHSTYGASETGLCTFNDADDIGVRAQSVGRALPGVHIAVRDSADQEVPVGQEGEVVVAGPLTAMGYFHRSELQAQIYREGWVHTNDRGTMDNRGFLYLRGRLSEMLNCGGWMVDPIEVEEVLTSHPLVHEALVSGEAHPSLNQIVVAKVVPSTPDVNERDLIVYCQHKLASFKVPRRIEVVERLPKTSQGKIKRRAV